MTNCIGAPDERIEEMESMIVEMQQKIDKLERDLFQAKQQITSYSESKFPKRSKDETEKMIADLTK